MHIVFLNPQGNFDAKDSYLTEHPDFGGQLVYVKETAMAMAEKGHKVDIVTRKINDHAWPEFAEPVDYFDEFKENLRILRFSCGGPGFLNKERLWEHLDEFVDNLIEFYIDQLPQFATAHYADGGYCAALLKNKTGIGFTFTGHSLGAQKLDKLGAHLGNLDEMEKRFFFSKRISAERLAMSRAYKIITSTVQEKKEQYSHPLYQGAVSIEKNNKFSVIPPGVNLRIFSTIKSHGDVLVEKKLDQKLKGRNNRSVLVSSRLDEKKNIIGVVNAYAESRVLQQRAGLVICIRGINDPFSEISSLPTEEQRVLKPILSTIVSAGIQDRVTFLNIQSQKELAAVYRYFAKSGSVFALTAFYEPFGLAPIEAAACGLVCVATKNGGPSEIFEDGSGVLVDPSDSDDISRGLLEAVEKFTILAKLVRQRVINEYTWEKTAENYLSIIREGVKIPHARDEPIAELENLENIERIRAYLESI